MPKPDRGQMMIQINAMLNNMKDEDLEKLQEKLQHPDQEEEGNGNGDGEGKEGKEGEEKGGEGKEGEGKKPEEQKPGGPGQQPKAGEQPQHQQGQAVHEYGKAKKS